ncbi:MAG: hypothetical protein ABJP87_04505 [Bauldia litoralis]|uniref:hypothetical protein n=1 Tax=Bauldia litoralis TaxID=665467 RepID=UPI003297DBCF
MSNVAGAPDTMQEFMEKERKRLNKAREDVLAKRAKFDEEIATIDKELSAIDAYDMAKQGKLPTTRTRAAPPGTRRTGIRDDIYNQVKAKPATRADLLDTNGAKGNKSDEQAISNALSALKKAGKLKQTDDGKYHAV